MMVRSARSGGSIFSRLHCTLLLQGSEFKGCGGELAVVRQTHLCAALSSP